MPDLERDLRALGAELLVPPAPDVAPAVGARLAAERAPRPRVGRPLVLALAALAIALAAALAVPQARTAILELLHIRGASVERVPTISGRTQSPLALGERVSPSEAAGEVDFAPVVPDLPGLGRPDAIYVDRSTLGNQLFFLYGAEKRPHLLVSEFRGDTTRALISKGAGPNSTIEAVTVNGEPGIWVGGVHDIYLRGPDGDIVPDSLRLSQSALLWQEGPLTFRIEGDLSKEQALDLAETLD
ncbi:MAG TPA: hypothetical protein VH306_10530 [Gaiellaceae bacterium]